jgi:hypothetical protein
VTTAFLPLREKAFSIDVIGIFVPP